MTRTTITTPTAVTQKRPVGWVVGLLVLGLLGGCGEEYLEVTPRDSITDANFYKTDADAIQATNAVYSELGKGGQYNYALWGIGEIMSDNSTTGGGGGGDGFEEQQLDNFNIPANNLMTSRLWGGSYVAIGRANIVLQKVPGIQMDEQLRTRCLGEARFLRAKFYFDLVRVFGEVPLITTPPANLAEARVARTPVDQVYALIKDDLTQAINALPSSYSGADLGRATKWAATGLLAKVHLTRNEKGEAARRAKEVTEMSPHALWADYGDNFKVANENGKESLFEVQYINGFNEFTFDGLGYSGNTFFGPRGADIVPESGYGFNVPEPDFVDGYASGDKRKAVTIWAPGDRYPDGRTQPASLPGSPNGYNCRKWFVGKTNTRVWDSPLNFPVLRLAEMYLILAEAVGNTPEGLAAVNKVRRRAFGEDMNATDAQPHDFTANTADFIDKVQKERRYELAFENDRWFDLKRTGKLVERMMATGKTNIRETNLVMPIPQSERDANPNLTQNPGY
ncbi:MAG: RagB/SusD family nutrient uptake outer membrane protein [Hymenobacteraceae bacterium]|nr:RagB/SusD family nutrient uptake outer membrane protein [Hymenobacteraceae bacterium]